MKRTLVIALLGGATAAAWWRLGMEPVAAPAAAGPAERAAVTRLSTAIASRDSSALPPTAESPPASPPSASAPAVEDPRQLARAIERALVASDLALRETAFNHLLPALLSSDPAAAVSIHARQEPGEPREALRDELARQWVMIDGEATVSWLRSLDEAERRAGATAAFRRLAASSTEEAVALADRFGIGRDDGSIERLERILAEERRQRSLTRDEDTPSGARGIPAN